MIVQYNIIIIIGHPDTPPFLRSGGPLVRAVLRRRRLFLRGTNVNIYIYIYIYTHIYVYYQYV